MMTQTQPYDFNTLRFLQSLVDQLIAAQFRIDDLQIVNSLLRDRLNEIDPIFVNEWENET